MRDVPTLWITEPGAIGGQEVGDHPSPFIQRHAQDFSAIWWGRAVAGFAERLAPTAEPPGGEIVT